MRHAGNVYHGSLTSCFEAAETVTLADMAIADRRLKADLLGLKELRSARVSGVFRPSRTLTEHFPSCFSLENSRATACSCKAYARSVGDDRNPGGASRVAPTLVQMVHPVPPALAPRPRSSDHPPRYISGWHAWALNPCAGGKGKIDAAKKRLIPNEPSYKTITPCRTTTCGLVKWITNPNEATLSLRGFRTPVSAFLLSAFDHHASAPEPALEGRLRAFFTGATL